MKVDVRSDTHAIGEHPTHATTGFRHEALLYNGTEEFVVTAARFIREGIERDEPILVVVSSEKIALLKDDLGRDARRVEFKDMDDVGSNPARIIPAWYDFVAARRASGHDLRGIGEPISPSRSPESLVECQRHEALLNLAFAESSWWLVCPYDTSVLDEDVLAEALRTHPIVFEGGARRSSDTYLQLEQISKPFDRPLPEPATVSVEIAISIEQLNLVRNAVTDHAIAFGLDRDRVDDLVVAVNEIATNSLRHGGGEGVLRIWNGGDIFTCEVRDHGRLDQPLVGRRRPEAGQEGGFGIWLVHQLCDLVQIRTFADGSVVRMHMGRLRQAV
jgi:anti-sigma regulatory factor (Ser/Thr protein kinase)